MDGFNRLGQALGSVTEKAAFTIADYKQALQNKLQSNAQDYVQNITEQNKQEVEQNAFNDSLQKMANEKADPNKVKETVETAQKQAVNKQNAKQVNKFQTEEFTKGGIDNFLAENDKSMDSYKRLLNKLNGYEKYKQSKMVKGGAK